MIINFRVTVTKNGIWYKQINLWIFQIAFGEQASKPVGKETDGKQTDNNTNVEISSIKEEMKTEPDSSAANNWSCSFVL